MLCIVVNVILNLQNPRRKFSIFYSEELGIMSKRKEFEREVYGRELLKLQAEEKAVSGRISLEEKAESRRLLRRLLAERQETKEEEARKKALENRQAFENQLRQGMQREEEMQKIGRKEFVELKMRQRIRENSEELRHLERQLRAAYVSKELAAQLAEKEADRLANKYHLELEKASLRKQWAEEAECEKELEKLKKEQKAQYLEDLLKQEKQEEERRREAYEDFLREKMLIDKVVQLMHEEDQRELEELMFRKKKTKDELDAFRIAQEKWKEMERISIEEENRRIVEYLKIKEEKELQIGKVMEERERHKAAIKEKLMEFIEEQERRQREQRDVLEDLHEEEMRLQEEERVRFELQERLFKSYELQVAEACARRERLRKLEAEAANEAMERQKMLDEMARMDKLEQLGGEHERRKKAEHRRAVEELLKERQKQREMEIAEIQRLQEFNEKEQEMRWRAIEEERLKMLREHAHKLIGFLPPGVLRQDDLHLLGLHSPKNKSEEEQQ